MKKIIAIIATKNRPNLLEKAIVSIKNQSSQPWLIIVSSDSNEKNFEIEKNMKKIYDFCLIKNENSKNYAGNLNNAIEKILFDQIKDNLNDLDDYFIAFLDDDDYWNEDYLFNCQKWINHPYEYDVVISNLNFNNIKKRVPKKLNFDLFLQTNPNIQGSNTFVKLTKILEAGCFDENFSATTDREFFTRLFMLNPKYKILDGFFVNINAPKNRTRISNNKKLKKDSLIKFFCKYDSIMSKNTKEKFINRSNMFVSINKNELNISSINNIINCNSMINKFNESSFKLSKNLKMCEYKLIISFIVSSNFFCNRVLNNINKLNVNNLEVIIYKNFDGNLNTNISNHPIKIFDYKESLKTLSKNNVFKDYLYTQHEKEIANSRTILQYLTYLNSKNGDVIWIIDDDMELIDNKNNIIDIDFVIKKYINKYDAVVGQYWYEPPLPLLSHLRTQLVDYLYNFHFNKKDNFFDIDKLFDYYYDLSDFLKTHLETPIKVNEKITIEDIFNHKKITRSILQMENFFEFKPNNRGGNTLIFNRELLLIPVIPIEIDDFVSRRGDFFWTKLCLDANFKIISSSFSIKHNRGENKFDYKNEINKFKKDIFGYSLTKTYREFSIEELSEISNLYIINLKKRLVNFIKNYFRIIGILKILKINIYNEFNLQNIQLFIIEINNHLNVNKIKGSLLNINNKVKRIKNIFNINTIKIELENSLKEKVSILGFGNEGIVFTNYKFIYKIYTKEGSLKNIKKYKEKISKSLFFENFAFFNLKKYKGIKYKYHDFETYKGGQVNDIIELIRFLKENNLILNNVKKSNFIVVNNKLKCVDWNFDSYSIKKFDMMVERFYQMIKYREISDSKFSTLICQTYSNNKSSLREISLFFDAINNKNKEDEHDAIIRDEIIKFNPKTLLDYGCGKCKIVNSIPKKIKIDVFDIDVETMKKYANDNLNINTNIENINKKFDLITSNLVLCVVEDTTCKNIIKLFSNLINEDGKLILSICNPYFDDVQNTIEKINGYNGKYFKNDVFVKKTNFINRNEFHRPFEWYENQLEKRGFIIENVKFDTGTNLDNLTMISERMIFICYKRKKINLINKNSQEINNNFLMNTNNELFVLINGINDDISSLINLLSSLKKQTNQNFKIIYFGNKKNYKVNSFLKMYIKYNHWASKYLYFYNLPENRSLIDILRFISTNLIIDDNSWIIFLHSTDTLLNNESIQYTANLFKDNDLILSQMLIYNELDIYNKYDLNSLMSNITKKPITPIFKNYLLKYVVNVDLLNKKFDSSFLEYATILFSFLKISQKMYITNKYIYGSNYLFKTTNKDKYKIDKLTLDYNQHKNIKTISVIGDAYLEVNSKEYKTAIEIGKLLIDNDFKIKCGGLGGVMEAVLKGARMSSKFSENKIISIIPGNNIENSNDYSGIVVPTNLGILRNGYVIDSDAVISLGGGAGTLSEIAFAWQKLKLIVSFTTFDGWSKKIAGEKIDNRIRYANLEDKVYKVSTPNEAIDVIKKNIEKYNKKNESIIYNNKKIITNDFHVLCKNYSSNAKYNIHEIIRIAKINDINALCFIINDIKNINIIVNECKKDNINCIFGIKRFLENKNDNWDLEIIGINVDVKKIDKELQKKYKTINDFSNAIKKINGKVILKILFKNKDEINIENLLNTLNIIKDEIDGIEVFNNENFENNIVDTILNFCKKNNLIKTVASDWTKIKKNHHYFEFEKIFKNKYKLTDIDEWGSIKWK